MLLSPVLLEASVVLPVLPVVSTPWVVPAVVASVVVASVVATVVVLVSTVVWVVVGGSLVGSTVLWVVGSAVGLVGSESAVLLLPELPLLELPVVTPPSSPQAARSRRVDREVRRTRGVGRG